MSRPSSVARSLPALTNRVADVVARLARDRELEPILAWDLRRAGDDLDRIAVLQSMAELDEATVHLRAGAQ